MSMCLTQGVTLLYSTIDIKLVFSSQCTVGAPVRSDKSSMYICIALFFLTALHIYPIYPSLESKATSGLICTFQ